MAETATGFTGAVQLLRNLGLFEIVLPIILTYAIVFGILQNVKLFRKESKGKEIANKELNAAIALIIALLLIGAANITGIIQQFMPFVGLISILAVCLIMIVGLISGSENKVIESPAFKWPLAIAAIIGFLFTFGMVAGWWDVSTATGIILSGQGFFSAENVSVLLFIAIIGITVLFLVNSVKEPAGDSK